MELIKKRINGKFKDYTEVRSPLGYCFYDVDESERDYTDYIATPILAEQELDRKFVLVEGDADVLNEQLQTEEKIEAIKQF